MSELEEIHRTTDSLLKINKKTVKVIDVAVIANLVLCALAIFSTYMEWYWLAYVCAYVIVLGFGIIAGAGVSMINVHREVNNQFEKWDKIFNNKKGGK